MQPPNMNYGAATPRGAPNPNPNFGRGPTPWNHYIPTMSRIPIFDTYVAKMGFDPYRPKNLSVSKWNVIFRSLTEIEHYCRELDCIET
jgi:hypothetical protein